MNVLCAIVVVTLLPGLTLGQGKTPADMIMQGRWALDQGNNAGAIRYFSAALKQQADNEEALLLRCKAEYQLKNYAAAQTDAQQILNIKPEQFTPTDYEALRNLGIIHNSRREFDLARRYLEQAKAREPKDARNYEDIGYSYFQQQNATAALAEFEAMTQVDPQSKKARYGLGKSLYMLQRYPEAIAAFDEALQLDPAYMMAYQNRGAAKMALGDAPGGCQDWQKAFDLGATELRPLLGQYCP